MVNIMIWKRILFMLSLLALPLTGCNSYPWESGMILNLKVDTPKDGTTVNTPTVMVSGRVSGSGSAGAKVNIDNIDVPVKDLKFSADVTLREQKSIINIDASSGQANLKEQVTVTYASSKQ